MLGIVKITDYEGHTFTDEFENFSDESEFSVIEFDNGWKFKKTDSDGLYADVAEALREAYGDDVNELAVDTIDGVRYIKDLRHC